MTRMLAFVAALLLTAITVSSACVAGPGAPLQFTIERSHEAGTVQLRFKRDRNGHSENTWNSSFRPVDLSGLDMAALDNPGTRPLRFAVIREAGRVDCAGTGGNAMARGTCTMTPNADFNRFLAERGIAPPSEDETFGMIALNVRRELVDSLARARYPTPTVDELLQLTAVEATPAYISALSSQGYRPKTLDELVQFAALKITPDYVGSFARAGYANIPADELVQLKALDTTPDFIAGFQRIGYGRLPIDTLVQLKAMDITPAYVRAVAQGRALPSPDHLVQLKAVSDDLRKR